MDLYMIISSFLAGVLGSMGFGGGSVLIIYLVSYLDMPQKQAQGINLIFFIPCALLSVISYRKSGMINFSQILPVSLISIAGAIVGFIVLGYIPTHILSKMFGGFLLVFGVVRLFRKC